MSGSVTGISSSVCKSVCSGCVDTVSMKYSYLPGDILIVGLFSIRQYGDTPYSCGKIRRATNDIITASAFIHSVLKKRSETGLNFGAVAVDDCYSGMNTTEYLLDLFTKKRFISDPETNQIINFDNVVAIVGALSSGVTLFLADMATALGIPVISYGASAPDLDNRIRYPYFLRTVPSDTLQVQGMIEVLDYLKATHVGLLYIDDVYGRSGKEALEKEAASRGICIEEPIGMTQLMTDEEVKSVIAKLIEQEVRVVLFFSIDSIAQKILDIIEKEKNNRQLTFVSSEGWGTNRNLLEGSAGLNAHGSIVFTIDTKDIFSNDYKNFLTALNITQTEYNYWLPNFFEDINDCDLKTSFEKQTSVVCTDSQMNAPLDTDVVNSLFIDQRGTNTYLAVHAVIEGYKAFCQATANCFLETRSNTELYVGHMKNVQMKNSKIFSSDGNGNTGFTIYNIQLQLVGGVYRNEYVKVCAIIF